MKELSIKAGVPTEKIITLYNFTLSQSLINSLPKIIFCMLADSLQKKDSLLCWKRQRLIQIYI